MKVGFFGHDLYYEIDGKLFLKVIEKVITAIMFSSGHTAFNYTWAT